jgi:hypothetical protein
MGCKSCKDKNLDVLTKGDGREDPVSKDIGFIIFNILIRIVMFVISLAATPIIMLFVIWMLFKTVILNKGELNLMPSLLIIGKKLGIGKKKRKAYKDDSEDINYDKPEDYELNEKVDKIKL